MMKHIESSVKVYSTTEYALFNFILGNRPLDEPRIKRITNEILDGNDLLRYYPINVYERSGRLDVKDGQHRFYISRKLRRPVYYILMEENKSMSDIARVNSNVGKWKQDDYINCYVQAGNDHYIKLEAFIETYQFSLGVCLLMLNTGTPGGDSGTYSAILNESFRGGTFEVTSIKEAVDLAENCKLFSDFAYWRSRSFVVAIDKIVKSELYPLKDLLADFKKRPEMLTQQANYKSYLTTMEVMVNLGKHKRILLSN